MDDKHETSEKVRRLEFELAFTRGSTVYARPRAFSTPWKKLTCYSRSTYKFNWDTCEYKLAESRPSESKITDNDEPAATTTPENDPIANGHNPAGLRRSQIDPENEGWRLLSLKEVADQTELQYYHQPFFTDSQHFDLDKNTWSVTGTYMAYGRTIDNTGTLRTKKPAGFYEKRVVKRPLRGDDFSPDKIYQVRYDPKNGTGTTHGFVTSYNQWALTFASHAYNFQAIVHLETFQIREFPAGQWRPMYAEETIINDGRKV